MKVRVVSRPTMATGFELAGLPVICVNDAAAAAQAVTRCASDTNVGIILVDEMLYSALPREFLARHDRQAVPMIAPLPGPRWDERGQAEAYVLEILRQAIGYRVRPR
jgi:vacuolar-type H+-ATPase subunit F/Vma7